MIETKIELTVVQKTMIEEFQCPGCVCGTDVTCGKMKLDQSGGVGSFYCSGHVAGTTAYPHVGSFFLGLPKGFCRQGPQVNDKGCKIRLWEKGFKPNWDELNIPVWAMEKNGYLFVRTHMPRIVWTVIDVIEGGTLSLCPSAVDVGKFIDEID